MKYLIFKTLSKFGYEVRRIHYPEWKNARAYWESEYLKRLGFQPRTVVDVGAAYGTPPIYEAFPQSFLVLIEPLKEYEPYLAEILEKYKGKYFLTALGARDEKMLKGGCIPFVPNDGGPVEIIGGDKRLIYQSEEEAVEKII